MQFGGKAARVAALQQQEARDVLVDLRLQFQRQQRHCPVVLRMVGDAEEVADALEGRPAVRDIAVVEFVVRVVRLEPLQHRGVEEQRHAELVVVGRDEELLVARRFPAVAGQLLALGDQEVWTLQPMRRS